MKETEYTKNIQAVDSMSDTELLITMLNAVTHGRLTETEAHDLARKIVEDKTFFSRVDTVSIPEFMELGLEKQEAVALVSMAEVLKRSLVKKYSASNGAPYRWSTGTSKKPWICAACKSNARIRVAPAFSIIRATNFAVIGSRGCALRSWRA